MDGNEEMERFLDVLLLHPLFFGLYITVSLFILYIHQTLSQLVLFLSHSSVPTLRSNLGALTLKFEPASDGRCAQTYCN